MRNKLPKILMLGWEFPPIINGGLGVACHDLSSAMSEHADITMIIPRSSPDFKMKNMNLVGINNLDPKQVESYFEIEGSRPFTTHAVPANLDPYFSEGTGPFQSSQFNSFRGEPGGSGFFNIGSLYGDDMMYKVSRFADVAAGLAAKMEFDVIHAHDWMTMLAGMKIRERSGKPLVIHVHSLEVDRSGPESKGWLYEVEKAGMECADLLIPVSNYTADNIRKYYHIDSSKIAVVHNGVSPVKPFKSERRLEEKTVLFVGRLTRQKGPEKFLDIAARVLEKKSDVRFVMAGVGDYFRNLLEQSSYKNIGNRFHLTGFLNSEKLRYLLSVSDVYCMPSVSEPFGLSAVEAAQFGVPCVISKQSGVSEVLSGALKFDFWDINKAADCIISLINNQVLRDKVVADATANLENVNWNNSASKVMQAYTSKCFI